MSSSHPRIICMKSIADRAAIATLAFAAILLSLDYATPSLAEANKIRIPSTQLRCIVDNTAVYLRKNDNPIIIAPTTCPKLVDQETLAELMSNSEVPVTEGSEESAEQRIIFFTRQQLECIKSMNFDWSKEFQEIPQRPHC